MISAGLSSANVTIMEIQSTATSLTNQQSQLNATLTNISGNARVDIDGCANCSVLNISLGNLHTGPYSVRRNVLGKLMYRLILLTFTIFANNRVVNSSLRFRRNLRVYYRLWMPRSGKLPVLNLFASQKSEFSPLRGDSLHRFM